MKKLILTLLVSFCGITAYAQTTPAEVYAAKVAKRMKDTLQLTNAQQTHIYQLNMQLHYQKMTRRQQYKTSDSLQIKVQQIENKRDKLYKAILKNDKYTLYTKKKASLLNNN